MVVGQEGERVVSGAIAPKIIPGYVGEPWLKRQPIEKCHQVAMLLSAAFDRNKLYGYRNQIADRQAIIDYALRGSWATVKLKLELGQATLPKEEVDLLIGAITLLE